MFLGRRAANYVRRSLRLKVTLGLVVPLIFILGAFTAVEHARRQAAVIDSLSFLASQIGQVIENSLQHTMLTRDLDGLQHMLDAIGDDETIRVVYLLNTSGRVIFAPDAVGVGAQLDNTDPTCQPCHRLPAAERPRSVVITLPNGQRVFRSMNPIENRPECHECHNPAQRLNGLLLTDISMAPLEGPLAADLRANLIWWGGVILVTLAVVNVAMSRLVVRRLRAVGDSLVRFGREQFGLRLPVDSPDEIGQLTSAFNVMGQRLEDEEAENRALAHDLRQLAAQRQELLQRLINAQEEERRRVARDLHDDLGQELAGLAFGLEGAERTWETQPGEALGRLQALRAAVGEITERVYEIILTLRPAVLDDLGLGPALRAQAERTLRPAGMQYELDMQGLRRRPPPEVEITLFRVFQEALSNAARHSRARRVRISLRAVDGLLVGEIADDGAGFDLGAVQANGHSRRGLGLLGMQERVAQWGGRLEIESQPGAGTRLRLRIPLTEKPCD